MIYISHLGSAGVPARIPVDPRMSRPCRRMATTIATQLLLRRVLQSVTRRASPSSMLNWHGWQLWNRCAGALGNLLPSTTSLAHESSEYKIREWSDLCYFRPSRRRSSPWMAITSNRHNPWNRTIGETLVSKKTGDPELSCWDEMTYIFFMYKWFPWNLNYVFLVYLVSSTHGHSILFKCSAN